MTEGTLVVEIQIQSNKIDTVVILYQYSVGHELLHSELLNANVLNN